MKINILAVLGAGALLTLAVLIALCCGFASTGHAMRLMMSFREPEVALHGSHKLVYDTDLGARLVRRSTLGHQTAWTEVWFDDIGSAVPLQVSAVEPHWIIGTYRSGASEAYFIIDDRSGRVKGNLSKLQFEMELANEGVVEIGDLSDVSALLWGH
ncbi:MAG: hypothetical protein KF743_14185 [Fimbriimonadaceae bacterium]|nr:hypothetical protein [Fimbriimonadaceae bacterium]